MQHLAPGGYDSGSQLPSPHARLPVQSSFVMHPPSFAVQDELGEQQLALYSVRFPCHEVWYAHGSTNRNRMIRCTRNMFDQNHVRNSWRSKEFVVQYPKQSAFHKWQHAQGVLAHSVGTISSKLGSSIFAHFRCLFYICGVLLGLQRTQVQKTTTLPRNAPRHVQDKKSIRIHATFASDFQPCFTFFILLAFLHILRRLDLK